MQINRISTKKELRRELLRLRREIPPEQKKAAEVRMLDSLCALEEFRTADRLLVYVSTEEELDTRKLIDGALRQGTEIFCPRCVPGGNEMRFLRVRSWSDLERGSYGISEPAEICEEGSFTASSLCIVPGLAFDSKGYRVGYGKGYYDRFLQDFPGKSAGLCLGDRVLESVFRDGYDVPVNMIVTEKRVIYTDK